ncbi:MAG: hypothetical protein QMD46_10085 [Methanomicrobiales archaeon]|nr:hypothetical protein [Methanomicrobiales archaeon]MDI6876749.1 hypothetical protein [Methanomicrobiales archaeon]
MKLDIAHKTFDIILCKNRLDRYKLIIQHDGMKRPAWYQLTHFTLDKESIKLKTLEAFSTLLKEVKKESMGMKSRWLQLDWIDIAAIDSVLTDYLNGNSPDQPIRINGQELPPVQDLAREYEQKTWALKPGAI